MQSKTWAMYKWCRCRETEPPPKGTWVTKDKTSKGQEITTMYIKYQILNKRPIGLNVALEPVRIFR